MVSTFLRPPFLPHPHNRTSTRQIPTCSLSTRALGVDYGLRRIGLAVSVGISPRSLPPLYHSNTPVQAARQVSQIALNNLCDTIIIGHPIDAYGRECTQVKHTNCFVQHLVECCAWATVVSLDERYTSQEAREILKDRGAENASRELEDGIAAGVLLTRYFGGETGIVVRKGGGIAVKKVDVEWGGGFKKWKMQAMQRTRETREFTPGE